MTKRRSVKPLQARIHTLSELQFETLKLIKGVRKQLDRMPYEDGLSDQEFLSEVVAPLEEKIRNDQEMERMRQANDQA